VGGLAGRRQRREVVAQGGGGAAADTESERRERRRKKVGRTIYFPSLPSARDLALGDFFFKF
jgi:hypothetical protein